MTATAENLQQTEMFDLPEEQPTVDDWSDWGAAIQQLESQETPEPDEVAQDAANDDDAAEAAVDLLDLGFVLSEQAISFAIGMDFEYDEKAKGKVLKAAGPLMQKHGATWLNWLGQYKEEILFLVAVVGLGGVTARQVKGLRAEKRAQLAEAQEKQEVDDGEKADPEPAAA
ncbi:hypothetical protein [Photobacterium sp. 1_MG-2023]|uniref:hypothetical protein n=1 Tax=Photobacterium sp. 1_MG-2023 TaxID=3062646 RepID=UPI0026E47B30|nr:hypothetical protein [Photobacterium sp. 1_MG-2023]MDO6708133.1 hypothetical protein [Photobacterium sp. 1_MG-2023]